jgi:hypothetical protein
MGVQMCQLPTVVLLCCAKVLSPRADFGPRTRAALCPRRRRRNCHLTFGLAHCGGSRRRSDASAIEEKPDVRLPPPTPPPLTQVRPSAATSGAILYAHKPGAICYPKSRQRALSQGVGRSHATARVPPSDRRRGVGVAAGGEGAATHADATGRLADQRRRKRSCPTGQSGCVARGPGQARLDRRPQSAARASLGRWRARPTERPRDGTGQSRS